MKTITLRPADPERDFGQLSAWFAVLEDDALSAEGLKEYYEKHRDLIIPKVAEDEEGKLLGFYWVYRTSIELRNIDLFVTPEKRRQGVGSLLYEDLEKSVKESQAKKLQVGISDTNSESREFAEKRGFNERWHFIPMRLNLKTFNDQPYEEIIAKLKGEGFRFTSMEELGNTEEAQHKLYALNDSTDADVPGRNGEHTWDSYEDFQKRVCLMDWYKPGGQKVVIDSSNGDWVAMSAISRFGNHAYNLHTGVDRRYRGRKLAQAVKVTALRYARDMLKVSIVHTDHNTMNQPMIAIDRKFGYIEVPGNFIMQKMLA
ncbi:MAG: GNAT family N-acetyltransferase [Chloroflexi bacterium]|nr:GNAT family N-acetyltransferase [Chloroflexota bacterium]